MSKTTILYENEMYAVKVIEDAFDVQRNTDVPGYGVYNKTTNIQEGTALFLGEALWRADMFLQSYNEVLQAQRVSDAKEDPLAAAAASNQTDPTIQ